MDFHLQWLGTSTFFFLPKNKKPEVLRNKPNLTDLQLLYFQSSKSIRTNMDVALPLWLTWMFTVSDFSNLNLSALDMFSSLRTLSYQDQKIFLLCINRKNIFEIYSDLRSSASFLLRSLQVHMCKISDKVKPHPKTTQTQLCVCRALTSAIGNSDQNWVNILRIFMSLWLLWVSFSLAYS